MNEQIINDYIQRASLAKSQADKYQRQVNVYSFIRLGVFILVILMLVLAIKLESYPIGISSVLFLSGCFAWLVSKQSLFEAKRDYFKNLKMVCDNEAGSMTTHSNIYQNGSGFADEKHYYTSDLDIFGAGSLFQLVNRAATNPGITKLAEWLSKAASKPTVESRQQAISELAAKNDWKLDFQASIWFATAEDKRQIEQLYTFLKLPLKIPGEKLLAVYCKIAPMLLIAAIVGAVYVPFIQSIAVLLGLANLSIVFSKASYIKKTDLIAGKIGNILAMYAEVFGRIETGTWQSPYLMGLALKISNVDAGSTSHQIKLLSVLINKLNYHLNIIVGIFLNLFFLWDIKQVIAIEKWKDQNSERLAIAFEVVAEFEATLSLTGLAINYPDWCMPQIVEGDGYSLQATQVGHPLINEKVRVKNDYDLADAFKVDIITGSNMAGKSTFLRTLGINVVLALAGAPVCASDMCVSVITIISYMRIKDSLNESTSTFKAELDRLQMLLAAVEHHEKVLFLIDEMLRGTNSVDKYKGSKAVIEKLIAKKGVGLVATHDLQIALLEQKYPDYVRNFYFDIQVKDGEMLFDYKIKHGECKTFNATLLLKQIGIEVD